MHGHYFLKDPATEGEFKVAYNAFGAHLAEMGYISAWRVMRRRPHDRYDSRPPVQPYYASFDFSDIEAALSCHDYVEANNEPLKSLHRAVNQLVVRPTTSFYLSEDY